MSGLEVDGFYKPYLIEGGTFKIENGWLEMAFYDYEIVNVDAKYITYKLPDCGEEKIISDIEKLYNFSDYYHYLLKDGIKTPYSVVCSMSDPDVENKFNQMSKPVFVRIDRTSSKSNLAFYFWRDAYNDLVKSVRTKEIVLSKASNYIFREYITDISKMIEFRCFVFKKMLRGISICYDENVKYKNINLLKRIIKSLVNRIIISTELDDCTIDLCILKSELHNLLNNTEIKTNSLTLIEINSPVYLYATSGLFELNLPYHQDILTGPPKQDILSYPIILLQNNTSIIQF